MQQDFTPAQLAELKDLAGGKSFPELARDLLDACDPDARTEAAKERFGSDPPTEDRIEEAGQQLAREAVTPFLKPAFRRRCRETE